MRLKDFISMKATIVYLLLLSAFAALGSIISQGQSEAFYIERYGTGLARVLMVSGLTDIYHSLWFVGFGVLLAALILYCNLRRLRHCRRARCFGSVILHLSFVVIIIGALLSAATAVQEDITLAPGEKTVLTEGALKDAKLKVNDFRIEWYDNGSASQYISDLKLSLANGKEKKDEISVNHPLRLGFVTIYQERYGWQVSGRVDVDGKAKPFRLKEGEDLDLGDGNVFAAIFIPHFNDRGTNLETMTQKPDNPCLVCGIENQGRLQSELGYLKPGDEKSVGPYPVHFEQFEAYTGLRVKYDLGIPVVFVGFFMALLGLALRFLNFKRKGGIYG